MAAPSRASAWVVTGARSGRRRSGPWTAREVQALLARREREPIEAIAQALGRTRREVEQRLADLGRRRGGGWTSEEISEFKRMYGTHADDELARIFHRARPAIRKLARGLCLSKDKAFMRRWIGRNATRMPRWREDELALLQDLYPAHSNLEIAQVLRRSVKSVVSKAHQLGLRKDEERLREMGRANVSVRYSRSGLRRVIVPQPPPAAAPRRIARSGA